jgi:hypothetical protein
VIESDLDNTFRSNNITASDQHKAEAVRQILFHAKSKINIGTVKEEASMKHKYNALATNYYSMR